MNVFSEWSQTVPSSIKDLNQKVAPLVTSQAFPVPCAEFTSLRSVLFRPLFFSLLHRSLRICIESCVLICIAHVVVLRTCCTLTLVYNISSVFNWWLITHLRFFLVISQAFCFDINQKLFFYSFTQPKVLLLLLFLLLLLAQLQAVTTPPTTIITSTTDLPCTRPLFEDVK